MVLHGSSKGESLGVLSFAMLAESVLVDSKEYACSELGLSIAVCSRSEQLSKVEALETVVEGYDVVERPQLPSCVNRSRVS
jgi:hypothetical protein